MGNVHKRVLEKKQTNWERLRHLYRVSGEIMQIIESNLIFLSKQDMEIILNNLQNILKEEEK